MEEIILVGYGGHAKSVADCIERQGKYRIIGYTDINKGESWYPYLGRDEVLEYYFGKGVKNAAICIGFLGKGNLRNKLYRLVKDIGFSLPVISDPSSIVSDDVKVGEGTFIGKGAIINTGSYVGAMCIINTKALIEHECSVGRFSHIAVGAVICGQVEIGENVFIGANATVIQGKRIESGMVVPAGGIVR